MRAALTRRYGPPDVVDLTEVPEPMPGPADLVVRVAAAPVTRADARIRALDVPAGYGPILRLVFGWNGPRRAVQGAEFAGVVERGAGAFAKGQRVMGITGMRGGAHAERVVIAAGGLVVPVPDTLSDVQAAAFWFGGLTAAHFLLDKGGLRAGQRVLIDGAGGAVGSAAIQIARATGARVVARCSPGSHDLARDLGAVVVDRAAPLPDGPFDLLLDVAGTWDVASAFRLLGPQGRFLRVTASLWAELGAALRPRRGGRRLVAGVVAETPAAMARLLALHAAGSYSPVVGAVLPFAQIRQAHALAGSWTKRGTVVVVMDAP
ncbi:MAG: zinc-binding dehydrogenase [Gemmobacter sp.]|nr:zinc-binding dehydrogenase [Gemmobacter sp.]